MTSARTLVEVIVALALLYAGWQLRGVWQPDRPPAPPDTIHAEGPDPDTSAAVWLPDVVTVYDTLTRTETRVDTVRVPTSIDLEGVLPTRAVRRKTRIFGPDRLELTYWQPDDRRWIQERYELERTTWGLYPELEAETRPTGLAATARAVLRWKRVSVWAGYTASTERGLAVGVRWRPVAVRW